MAESADFSSIRDALYTYNKLTYPLISDLEAIQSQVVAELVNYGYDHMAVAGFYSNFTASTPFSCFSYGYLLNYLIPTFGTDDFLEFSAADVNAVFIRTIATTDTSSTANLADYSASDSIVGTGSDMTLFGKDLGNNNYSESSRFGFALMISIVVVSQAMIDSDIC
jgi:hypothetical protein